MVAAPCDFDAEKSFQLTRLLAALAAKRALTQRLQSAVDPFHVVNRIHQAFSAIAS